MSSAKFWDKVASKYSKQPVPDESVYQKKVEMTQELLRPNHKVLEIGCGTGSTAILHAPMVEHMHAVDCSSNMLAIASEKTRAAGINNLSFERVDLESLALAENSVDAALAMSILHLVKDRDTVIKEISKGLKPNGVFVSSTPCLSGFWRIFSVIGPIGKKLGFLPLVKTFNLNQLKSSMQKHGFEITTTWKPKKSLAVFIIAKKIS